MRERTGMSARLWVAYVLAPLATVPTLTVLTVLGASFTSTPLPFRQAVSAGLHISFFFALFGLPLAYAAQVLLIMAVRTAGIDPQRMSAPAVLIAATGVGAIVFGVFTNLDGLGFASGAVMGLVAALVFVVARGRPAASAPTAS